jgi:protein gp37
MGNVRYKTLPSLVTVHEDLYEVPLRWKEPRMIFTCSMSDFFHEKISEEQRDLAISTIKRTPQHVYQILTKRSHIMKQYGDRIGGFPDNIWLGVSVEDARFKFRIEHLRQADAATKFLSFEPLIGAIGKFDLERINWVIVGGESGPNHRPINLDWAREIRDKCLASGVPFFFKQVGGLTPKSGGRMLDGREWNEFPTLQTTPLPRTTEIARPMICPEDYPRR